MWIKSSNHGLRKAWFPIAVTLRVSACLCSELTNPSGSIAGTWVSASNLLPVPKILFAVDYVLVAAMELARVYTSSVIDAVVTVAVLDLDVELEKT